MTFWKRLFRPHGPSLPELFADSEAGFVDGSFRIVNTHSTQGVRSFHLRAKSGAVTVGFTCEVLPGWRPDTLGEDIPVFWGSVRYRSLGPESNAFVRALARAYAQPGEHFTMPATVDFQAVALSGDPNTFAGGDIDMKLFFEPEDPARYAEVYTNLHLATQLAEFREKDNGYRQALINALGSGAA